MTQKDQSPANIALRWALPTAAALLFGPLVAAPVAGLRDGTGGSETTLLTSAAPLMGVLALVIVALVAGAGGGLTARLTAAGTGRTFAGLCIGWAAMRTGNSWDILMLRGGSAVTPLVIEGMVVALAAAAVVVALMVLGGGRSRAEIRADVLDAVRGKGAALGIALGVVGAIIGTALVGLDGSRGQCLLAGIAGGVLAAVAVQMATPDLTPERARLRASIVMLVMMVVSPLALLVVPGSGEIASAARAGTLIGPGLVQPLDWMVAIFLGVPTGMAWVGSMTEKTQAATPKKAAA